MKYLKLLDGTKSNANKFEYKDKNGNYLCVDNCKSINKIRDENKCVNQCPFNKKIKYELNGDIICDENCPNNMYMKYDSLSSQYSCVTNCKDNNLYHTKSNFHLLYNFYQTNRKK